MAVYIFVRLPPKACHPSPVIHERHRRDSSGPISFEHPHGSWRASLRDEYILAERVPSAAGIVGSLDDKARTLHGDVKRVVA
jgi:hypothetical protein